MEEKLYKSCTDLAVTGESIADVMQSIALEQAAIARILDLEGEKLKELLASELGVDELKDVNSTIADTVQEVTCLEIVVLSKLKAVAALMPHYDKKCGVFTVVAYCEKTRLPLCGARVKVLNVCTGDCVRGVTDNEGIATFCTLEYGCYCAELTHCDICGTKKIEFEIKKNDCHISKSVQFECKKNEGQICLYIKGCVGVVPERFCIKLFEEKQLIDEDITEDGVYIKSELPCGEYCLEITNPDNGECEQRQIIISQRQLVVKLTLCYGTQDECQKIKVCVLECDSKCEMKDIAIAIMDSCGKKIAQGATDCDGVFCSEPLCLGKYIVEAKNCKNGQIRREGVTLCGRDECVCVKVCFCEVVKYVDISGKIVDQEKKPICGAEVMARGGCPKTCKRNGVCEKKEVSKKSETAVLEQETCLCPPLICTACKDAIIENESESDNSMQEKEGRTSARKDCCECEMCTQNVITDCNGNYCIKKLPVGSKFAVVARCGNKSSQIRKFNNISASKYTINLMIN